MNKLVNKNIAISFLAALILVTQCLATKVNGDNSGNLSKIRRHQNWFSAEIKAPLMDLFLAGRAATQNKDRSITLVVEYSPDKNICNESVMLFIEHNKPAETDTEYTKMIELTFDNQKVEQVDVTITTHRGSSFTTVNFPKDFQVKPFGRHKTLIINLKRITFDEFSLLGFNEAQKRAKSYCRNHIPN